jgi:zinc/manganese transport system permease protein
MSETADFFLRQIVLLAIVLVLHTYIGLHIIRRTLIFSDLVLDQLAALGALIGIGIGVQYGSGGSYLVSLGAVLVGAWLLAVIKPKNRLIPREAVIGILYAMALVATLLLGDKLSGGGAHVTKTLAGSMLWVTWPLVIVTAATYAGLTLFHVAFRERFIGMTRDREAAASAPYWDFLLFATQGIITVLIVPIAGVLLAYAFLMVPAATAAMFTRGWGRAVLLGWAIGFTACLAGLTTSYTCDLPYGPTLVLCLGACFLAGAVVRIAIAREKD